MVDNKKFMKNNCFFKLMMFLTLGNEIYLLLSGNETFDELESPAFDQLEEESFDDAEEEDLFEGLEKFDEVEEMELDEADEGSGGPKRKNVRDLIISSLQNEKNFHKNCNYIFLESTESMTQKC